MTKEFEKEGLKAQAKQRGRFHRISFVRVDFMQEI